MKKKKKIKRNRNSRTLFYETKRVTLEEVRKEYGQGK